jgi:hypothetical protein
VSSIPYRKKAIVPAKQSARRTIDASRMNRSPRDILIASAAPAARVIAVFIATNRSKCVGPGRIRMTAQIDRKIRNSAAKSQVSIMKYTTVLNIGIYQSSRSEIKKKNYLTKPARIV